MDTTNKDRDQPTINITQLHIIIADRITNDRNQVEVEDPTLQEIHYWAETIGTDQ